LAQAAKTAKTAWPQRRKTARPIAMAQKIKDAIDKALGDKEPHGYLSEKYSTRLALEAFKQNIVDILKVGGEDDAVTVVCPAPFLSICIRACSRACICVSAWTSPRNDG
jgi:hypothetical protein